VISQNPPLLFAPLPGVNNHSLLESLDQNEEIPLTCGLSRKGLNTWLEDNPDFVSFSIVDHPLERAYNAFMSHIFSIGKTGFPKIRKRLCEHFGLELPTEDEAWSIKEHANAFDTFLRFLKSNLAGQTSIRIDANWEAQHRLIAALYDTYPMSRVFKRHEFEQEAEKWGLPVSTTKKPSESEFKLADIYSPQLEKRARSVYAVDYRVFGFKNWCEAQAA